MAGIGEASAILGVAQIGIQLAQTLVTVIGDYRDAAVNINRLRDEIHLTSICLQQLGDLAKQDRLLAGRGVLEATNLRERCRAVIWDIRRIISKGDAPLQPEEILKDEIDVTYFTAWKWALWTKKHLEEPRLELDRLKDSMTLTFVSQMALTAASDRERAYYTAQIPGIRRNVYWGEEKYREDQSDQDEVDPALWEEFMNYKQNPFKVDNQWFREHLQAAGVSDEQITTIFNSIGNTPVPRNTEYQAWSIDPLAGRTQMPVVATKQPGEKLWNVHSKLLPWYKQQIEELKRELNAESLLNWELFSLKLNRRSSFLRRDIPPMLEIVLQSSAGVQTTTYMETIEMKTGDLQTESLTDEQIIEDQLALYQ